MNTAFRIVLPVLAIVFLLGFVLNLVWFLDGSLEPFPTPEQQEKARIGAALGMGGFCVSCLVCTVLYIKLRRK